MNLTLSNNIGYANYALSNYSVGFSRPYHDASASIIFALFLCPKFLWWAYWEAFGLAGSVIQSTNLVRLPPKSLVASVGRILKSITEAIMPNSALVISSIPVRLDNDGRYCLNDLHKASGNKEKHKPKFFLANQQTKELINEISAEGGIPPSQVKHGVGSYAVRELVLFYAMWISPSFSLKVIRAYDSLVTETPITTDAPRQRFLMVVEGDKTYTKPIADDAYILSREQIKKNIHDVMPGYKLIPLRLHQQLIALQKELSSKGELV